MTKKIEMLIKGLIGLTFFVPLVLMPSQFIFPFIVPKIVLFRTITLCMIGGYVLLLASDWERYALKMTPIKIAVLIFFASFTISTFVGLDWYHSFWDNHERMLGLFTIAHYVAYYLIAATVVREWRDWRWLLRVFLFAGGIVMFIGFLQEVYDPTLFLNSSGSRVASTLGNPIYVGGYGLFLSCIGWLLFITEEKKAWKIYGAVGAFFGVAGIFMSGTRGALIGLLAGVVVLCIAYVATLKGHPAIKKSTAGVLAALAAIAVFLFAFRQTAFVQRLPAIGSLVNTSLHSGDAATRLMAWGVAYDAWKDHPIFGWGPNNFFYAFNKYYRPQFLEHGWGETWFDNAHNILMNTLAVQGALGLLAYLGMFAATVLALWKRQRFHALDIHIVSVGTAFLAAHLVQDIFVFENPTSYLYFFFFMALLDSAVIRSFFANDPGAGSPQSARNVSGGLAIVVSLLVLLLVYATDVNPARANTQTLALLRSLYNFNDPIGQYQQTIAIPSPHIDDIRNDFARTVFLIVPKYIESGHREEAKQILLPAYDELRKNRALHPYDIRVHLQQAQLAEQGAMLFQNVELLLDAEQAITDALQKSPHRQQVAYTLASIKFDLGKYDEAAALLQQTIDDDPKIGEGWWRLALLYREAHRQKEAQDVVRKARAFGVVFDGQGEGVVNSILPPETGGTDIKK